LDLRRVLIVYPAVITGIAMAICIEKGFKIFIAVTALATLLISLYFYRVLKDRQSLA